MQGLPSKTRERFTCRYPKVACLGLEAGAVDIVAQKRMPDGGEVDPDLVGAPGLQPAFDQACHLVAVAARIRLKQRPVGHGLSAGAAHRHLIARVRMTLDRLVD